MMPLEDVYYASQVVAAVAIIGSLIYLGVQTQQTSKNQRAMMHWNRMVALHEATSKLNNPTFASISRAGVAADPQMDLMASHAFAAFARAQLFTLQEVFLEHGEGMIDDRRWDGSRNGLKAVFSFPGYRAAYKLNRATFDSEFVALVDALIIEANKTPPLDQAVAWQKMAAKALTATSAGA